MLVMSGYGSHIVTAFCQFWADCGFAGVIRRLSQRIAQVPIDAGLRGSRLPSFQEVAEPGQRQRLVQPVGACAAGLPSPSPGPGGAIAVLRGGSWNNRPGNLRTANRNRNTRDNRNDNIGFRVARTLQVRNSRSHGFVKRCTKRPGPVGWREAVGRAGLDRASPLATRCCKDNPRWLDPFRLNCGQRSAVG